MAAPQPLQLSLTDLEKRYYSDVFVQADADGDGWITSKDAQFLRRSGLGAPALKEIWKVSDAAAKGYLSRLEFAIALRLVAVAQTQPSTPLTLEAAKMPPAVLPVFEGISVPASVGARH
eukprot:tig00020703_g13109.t1